MATYPGTYQDFALEVNTSLGGSYVGGMLTPPSSWTQSVTEWSRYVQQETATRAVGITFSTTQSQTDSLHYGGYPAGSVEANEYIRLVEATGWVWSEAQGLWVRKDSGYVYIPPEPPPEPPPTPPVTYPDTTTPIITDLIPTTATGFLIPFALFVGGLYAFGRSRQKNKSRKVKK